MTTPVVSEPKRLEFLVTKKQAEVLNWAATEMADFWMDEAERAADGNATYRLPLTVDTERGRASIVDDKAVLLDLRYRLLEQLPDMAAGSTLSPAESRAQVKIAELAYDAADWAFRAVYES
jgi:hypothetical protein